MENITAKVSCFARAYHYKNSTSPIFADTAAEALLGQDYDRIAESMTQGVGFFLPGFNGSPEEGLRLIVDRQLSPSVLGRSAYCERMLENETRLGCRQYVIFASGYDTYYPILCNTKGWRQLAGIEHTQTATGACPNIKEPTATLHSWLNGLNKSLYLPQNLMDGFCNQHILLIDVLQ